MYLLLIGLFKILKGGRGVRPCIVSHDKDEGLNQPCRKVAYSLKHAEISFEEIKIILLQIGLFEMKTGTIFCRAFVVVQE